jgi:hypothetical protein
VDTTRRTNHKTRNIPSRDQAAERHGQVGKSRSRKEREKVTINVDEIG